MSKKLIGRLIPFWITIGLMYFLWESSRYGGLFGRAAEWQINLFGFYKPALTVLLLLLLVSLPILLLALFKPRQEKVQIISPGADLYVARRYLRLFEIGAVTLTVCSLSSAAWTLLLPGASGPVHRIEVESGSAANPPEGSALLIGGVPDRKIVGFNEDYLLGDKKTRYVALRDPAGNGEVRFFVELKPEDLLWRGAVANAPREGILVRNSLPGAIRQAYANLGYPVAENYLLLHRSNSSIRRPYFLTAVELGLAGMTFWVVVLLQSRRIGRLRDEAEARSRPTAS